MQCAAYISVRMTQVVASNPQKGKRTWMMEVSSRRWAGKEIYETVATNCVRREAEVRRLASPLEEANHFESGRLLDAAHSINLVRVLHFIWPL